MKLFINPGTKIDVRRPATGYRPYNEGWRSHKTTKPIEVPHDARSTVRAGGAWVGCVFVREFTLDGWEIRVDESVLAKSTTRAERDASGECERCRGKGIIPSFSHVQGGVCFKCGGTGSPRILPAGAL